eukprot:7873708-Lingulodinium_polyedra.AAC.1
MHNGLREVVRPHLDAVDSMMFPIHSEGGSDLNVLQPLAYHVVLLKVGCLEFGLVVGEGGVSGLLIHNHVEELVPDLAVKGQELGQE